MKRTETSKKKTKVIARPTKWSEVRLKCVPLQPDEEGFGNEVSYDNYYFILNFKIINYLIFFF